MKYALFLFLVLVLACQKATPPSGDGQFYIDQLYLDQLFEDYSENKPGVSILVVKEGEILLKRSYGLADLETGRAVHAGTNFRLASVSKQFTALAVMQLIAAGELSYETSLREIFPEFAPFADSINVFHLLTHRAGLPNYGRFLAEGRTAQILDPEILDSLLTIDSTVFKPGSQYSYSNTGYAVLSQIVAQRSGESFADYVQANIFEPLGMESAQVYQKEVPIAERAYGYLVQDSIVNRDQNRSSAVQGDGGIYMSTQDYLRWDQALYTNELLPQEALQRAFTAWDGSNDGYGLGWRIREANGLKVVSHGGSSTGFGSQVIRIPKLELTVALFTNRSKRDNSLLRRCQALASHYSSSRYPQPIEMILEYDISQLGITLALANYQRLKKIPIPEISFSETSLFYLGLEYINADNYEVAEALFRQTIKDDPAYFGGHYGMGNLCYELDRHEEAIGFLRTSVDLAREEHAGMASFAQKRLDELEAL